MRGFWFMIEAIIAGMILVGFLSFLVTVNLSAPDEEMSMAAFKSLSDINKQGLLKEYAQDENYTAINDQVKIYSLNNSIAICTLTSCVGDSPSGSNIWIGSYITPGYNQYFPREVKLYVYR